PDRVEELRVFFSDLKAAGAKLTIITKGNVGACRFLLQEEGLLGFFEKVFGMLGQFYGESEFDQENKQPSELEGTPDCQLPDMKVNLIQALMSQAGLSTNEAALVEDDAAEIASVKGVCRSVFVSERKGMTAGEMQELRSMVGVQKEAAQAKSTAAPKQMPSAVATAPAEPKVAKEASSSVKHVYFDFDQTISRVHVFKQLAGWEPGVAGQHSLSERGQIHRLKLLNDSTQYQYQPNGHVVPCPAGVKGAASWTAGALGGPDRVEELRVFFSDLKAAGAKLTIITKGNVGACRFLLQEEGLLGFFEKVFGMLGQFYGESEFDQENKQPSELEGTPDCQLPDMKVNLIQALMSQAGLSTNEAALVEDDAAEIASVKGVCRSVFVSERKGMTAGEMQELRSMVGVQKEAAQAKSTAAPKQMPSAVATAPAEPKGSATRAQKDPATSHEQAEASDTLQARLTQVLASEAATQTKLQEAQAFEATLTTELEESKAAVAIASAQAAGKEVLQKELETAKSAANSLEASKTALEKALEEQKNTSASLEDQLYQQRQLLDEQTEASDTLQARLTQVLASEAATQTKLQEAQTLEDALTQRLSNSQAAEAVFEELNGDMISKLHMADQRMVALAEELTTSKETLRSYKDFKMAMEAGLVDFKERMHRIIEVGQAGHATEFAPGHQDTNQWQEVKQALATFEQRLSNKDVNVKDESKESASLAKRVPGDAMLWGAESESLAQKCRQLACSQRNERARGSPSSPSSPGRFRIVTGPGRGGRIASGFARKVKRGRRPSRDEDNQNIEATEARPPQVDVVKRARQMAKKLALNLEAKCLEEARTGKRAAEWSSGDIHGLGREAGEALLSEVAHEVQKMEFAEVEWWRGPVIGWTPEAGATSLDPDETRPIPWKQFGSWGLALKLRVSWEASKRPPREPKGLQTHLQTPRSPSQTRQSDSDRFDSERSDFSVSPRPIRSVSHSRPSACIICHDNSNRQAKLLPCGHCFCRHCARRSRGRPCVQCGTICADVSNMADMECPDRSKSDNEVLDGIEWETYGDSAPPSHAWGMGGKYSLRPFAQRAPRSQSARAQRGIWQNKQS
ncbi:unnamed protein product, partial [Cladocopium goreaui]